MYLIVAAYKVPQLRYKCQNDATMEFYPNVFTEFVEFCEKNIFIFKKDC